MQIIPYGIERFASERFNGFRKTEVHAAGGTAADLEADLAVLRAWPVRAKLRRVVLLVVALVVAAVTGLAAADARGDDQPIIGAIGAFIFIVLMVMRMRQPKRVEMRRIELASGLLRRLKVGPQGGRLKLDLAPIMSRRKKAGKENGFDIYNDPFLELDVVTPDGTRVKIERTEQLQYYEYRTSKRHVREWKGIVWDTITINVPAGTDDYRDQAPRNLSHVTANVLLLLKGFEGVSFEARPEQLRVVIKSTVRWDATPDGEPVRKNRSDSVETISLWLGQLAAPAKLSITSAPQPAWKAKLPIVGLRGATIILGVCALAGLGLTLVSGFELPQHYELSQQYGTHGFEEDLIRTSAFGFGCCALPLAGCFGLIALARKRRRAYES